MKRWLFAVALFLSAICLPSTASAACVYQSISIGDTVTGSLSTDDCVLSDSLGQLYYSDVYQFTGATGQQIYIQNSSSAIDVDLDLYYPDESHLYYDDDSGGGTNARIPGSGYLTLSASGLYTILASSPIPQQTGAYTLMLSAAAIPISGSCGSAHGSTVSTTPTANLCATGIASSVSGSGPWAWTCQGSNGGSSASCSANLSSANATTEYYNTTLMHYFVTASPDEANGIDNGAAGSGWVKTGFSFNVADASTLGAVPVCRFYGTLGVGPNSHFYTADAGECEFVKKDPGWFYEGIAFHIQPPQSGSCPAGTQPIYRVYNNRAQYNDSNHRFVTNDASYQQMGERNWDMEGIVMCSSGLRSPTGITGGTFSDPSGASATVTSGAIPSSVNITQPTMKPAASVPPGLTIDPAQGDVNVTRGAPGYEFNLTGDNGFKTTTAGAVKVSIPFDASAIPAADQGNTLKIFLRVFNPQDGSQVELTGDIAVSGVAGMLTVETRGLPLAFTAVVIYNPNMETVTSEEATALGTNFHAYSTGLMADRTALATWPTQSWCVVYNGANPNLIAAVKTLLGLAGNPSRAQIRSVVLDKVAGNARIAQGVYQTDGFNGPNMYVGRTACRDNTARYNIHLIDSPKGAHYMPDDPNEWENPLTDGRHFGRLYIVNSWIDGHVASMLDIVAHEMLHGVQDGYQIWGYTPKGYKEGSATTYGRAIANGLVISVREKSPFWLDESLMTPGEYKYNNQDFFAYVGKQYNSGSLSYIAGLYAQMHTSAGAVNNPGTATLYGAMNTYFNTKFSQSLQSIYLDFVKQRALTHNASSQFGRAGETVSGFAENLFGASSVFKKSVDIATCSKNKDSFTWSGVDKYAVRAIVINPTGVLPAGSTSPTLSVKITPASSSVGALWNGFTWRANTATALAAANKFTTFGKQANDQIVVLAANLDTSNSGVFNFEITCEGPVITALSPAKGPTGTSVTISGSGFGTSADTRSVYFNGLKASIVTWNSDTSAVAKVPQNASSGEVVVEVNGVKSNGVNFEVLAQCSSTQNAGGDTPDTRTIELGQPSGTFNFSYETYSQKDQILVRYEGNTLFDTGCVGDNGTEAVIYSGSSTQITVQVIPNCAGGSGTAWNYTVACPK